MDHRWPDPELARPEKVRWVARAGRPGSALLSWLAGQSLSSTNSTTAYVTGEAWLCAMVHGHLVRGRGFPTGAVRTRPYWKTKFRSPGLAESAADVRLLHSYTIVRLLTGWRLECLLCVSHFSENIQES